MSAYTEHRDRLAQVLYEFIQGPGSWEHVDDFTDEETNLREFYTADADEILALFPHLTPEPIRALA